LKYQIALWLILTCLSAILYRCGGAGAERGWNTKYRDIGTPLCVGLIVLMLGSFHWSALVSMVLMFGAMTTYWKKEADAKWLNWLLTGFGYAMAWLPYCIYTNNPKGFAVYVIIVSIGSMMWSEAIDNDIAEECGRGFIVAFFAPLLANSSIFILK